jgi:hypothetical protein
VGRTEEIRRQEWVPAKRARLLLERRHVRRLDLALGTSSPKA